MRREEDLSLVSSGEEDGEKVGEECEGGKRERLEKETVCVCVCVHICRETE